MTSLTGFLKRLGGGLLAERLLRSDQQNLRRWTDSVQKTNWGGPKSGWFVCFLPLSSAWCYLKDVSTTSPFQPSKTGLSMRDNKYKQVACYRLLFQTTQPQDRRIITQTLPSPLRFPTSRFSHQRSSLAGFVHRLCLSPVSKHSHRATLRQFIQIKCINTQSLQKRKTSGRKWNTFD